MANLYDSVDVLNCAIARGERSTKLRTRERNANLARYMIERKQFTDLRTIDLSAIEVRLQCLDRENAVQREQQAERIAAEGAFFKLSLPKQCESLGIPLEILVLDHTREGWIVDGVAYRNPELAAFTNFRAQGYDGMHCEGSAVISLMKCACLDYFSERAWIGVQKQKLQESESRIYACTGGFDGLCNMHEENIDEILATISLATDAIMQKHIQEFVSAVTGGGVYEGITGFFSVMTEQGLWAIWKALGAVGLAKFAQIYLQEDPSDFRAGWPDLTIVKDVNLRFVEVKTSDKIHASQLDTFRGLLFPAGANVSVLKLTARTT